MDIFEYIDKKRAEYESLRNDSQLELKKNKNKIQKISAQIEQMTEEKENPSQFFLPETRKNYKEEIEKLQEKLHVLEAEGEILGKKIELCKNEIYLLDTLELPDFSSAQSNMEWKPMWVSEEEFQKKNVSRETMNPETSLEIESGETSQNVSYETMVDGLTIGETGTNDLENLIDKNLIKEKICFCRQISELDPRRCSLMLDEIINEIL